jgi:hypothetical protein
MFPSVLHRRAALLVLKYRIPTPEERLYENLCYAYACTTSCDDLNLPESEMTK